MTWAGFLAQLGESTYVTLIGPLHNADVVADGPTVFVDGGTQFRRVADEKFPCVSVGDGDSGSAELDVRLKSEKDFSDLAFVLRELPLSVVRLRLLGFVGGRLDHELANLGELHQFLSARGAGALVEMWVGGQKKIIGVGGKFEGEIHGIFSVMVLAAAKVSISGDCQYKLNGTMLHPASSYGLSNVGAGKVLIQSDSPAFVLINHR